MCLYTLQSSYGDESDDEDSGCAADQTFNQDQVTPSNRSAEDNKVTVMHKI